MSKLDSRPRYSAAKGKSHHVMSHNFKFTAAAGHLNPIDHDILLPGDKIVYRPNFRVTCAQPMLAPAMCDIDFHVDTFFVPMTMLYTPFEALIYGTSEIYSSNWPSRNQEDPMSVLPYLDGSKLMKKIAETAKSYPVSRRIPETIGQSWVRLASLLGLNPNIGYKYQMSVLDHQSYREHGYMPNFFPYQLLAYEAIYQNYFRLDDYEEFSNSFNVDTTMGEIQYSFGNVQSEREPWCIRYRPAYSDYFNSVKLSPLLTDTNIYQGDDDRLGNLLQTLQDRGYQNILRGGGNLLDTTISPDVSLTTRSIQDIYNTSILQENGSSALSEFKYGNNSVSGPEAGQNSVLALRTLFANEKLLMVTDRAKKNYDAQTLAHFGVKVPHDVLHQLTHLSHDVFSLSVNEMVSTADTAGSGGAPLGEYFGKGYAGKNTKEVRFTAPCHGVFMCIFSVAPRYDYVVDFLRKNQVAERLDFFQPEYDALGMQPVYRYELRTPSVYTSKNDGEILLVDGAAVRAQDAFNPQGWTYRYSQFKRNIDRATIAFSPDNPNTYASWALTRRPYRGIEYGRISFDNQQISDYNDHRSFERFVVLPSDLDQLFGTSYYYGWKVASEVSDEDWDANQSLVFARDPFVVNAHLGYDKFSIMSLFSMPKLM